MTHNMVYGIAGAYASNMAALKAAGFIDFHLVIPGGAAPTTSSNFVKQCNDLGVSPVLNNGNDGISGCAGYDPNSYYKQVADLGWHAAGGESEPNGEWKAIMNNLVGMDYGGEWNCCNDLSNIWVHQMAGEKVTGKGMCAYLETYVGVCGVYLCPDAVVKAAVACKNAGCKEVGLMIGGWMVNHGIGAQPYIDIIQRIEAAGVTVSGVVLWWGHGSDMNNTYNVNAGIIRALQAVWPPEMTTLKNRFTQPPEPVGKEVQLNMWVVDQQVDVSEDVAMGGRLIDPDGTPIAGQSVEVLHYVNYDTGRTLVQDGEKTTDDKGEVWYWFHGTRHYVLSYYLHFIAANGYKEQWAGPLDIYVHQPRAD